MSIVVVVEGGTFSVDARDFTLLKGALPTFPRRPFFFLLLGMVRNEGYGEEIESIVEGIGKVHNNGEEEKIIDPGPKVVLMILGSLVQ